MTRDELLDLVPSEELLFLEGPEFDAALVGVVERFGGVLAACYDYTRILQVLEQQGMSYDDAVEWFDFNMIGAYLGDSTPVYLRR